METWLRSCFGGVMLIAASLSIGKPAAAQVFVGGIAVDGVELSAFGGATSISVESYSSTPGFAAGVVRPYPVVGWGGLPYSSPFGGYGGYFGSAYGNPWYPPVVVPAEWFYGPSAMEPLTALGTWSNPPNVRRTTIVTSVPAPVANPMNNGNGPNAPANPNRVPPPPLNFAPTNAATQARARKIVDTGDAAFAQQRYADALASYKDAARAAPDLAETHFRQAATHVALGRYEDAVAAIKLGLRLQSTWVDSPFRFAALYGPADLARRQHLDALRQVVDDRPSSDLLFLCGVLAYFDDAPQRAEPLFARAAALAIGETWHIGLFQEALKRRMPAAQPVEAAKPVVPPAAGARDI